MTRRDLQQIVDDWMAAHGQSRSCGDHVVPFPEAGPDALALSVAKAILDAVHPILDRGLTCPQGVAECLCARKGMLCTLERDLLYP